jgi:membrane-associated PAP2 superfamily phosphatase
MTYAPVKTYRRYWFPELLIVLTVLGVSTGLCLLYPIDLHLARWFYRPPGTVALPHWPYGGLQPWKFLNQADMLLTVLLITVGLIILICSFIKSKWRFYRLYALFIILSLLIGPGLLVNGVFKDHWGRPRPVDVKDFGGSFDYRPPLLKGSGPGRSFPSGHASVAFEYLVFWFILRRKKRWAVPALLTGLTLGVVMSYARMAAGAHFLSDVIWSAGLTYLVSFGLYYFILKIPAREDRL